MNDLKHMDAASRNQRLRETLEGMGLVVIPVFRPDEPDAIDHLLVSATLPNTGFQHVAQDATGTPVATPVACSEIPGSIGATKDDFANVVDFPPKV